MTRWLQIHSHWVERAKYAPFLAAALDAVREIRDRPPEALARMFHGAVRDPKRKIISCGLKWWQSRIESEIVDLLETNRVLPSADVLAERVVYTQLLRPEFFAKDRQGNIRSLPTSREHREIERRLPRTGEGIRIEHGFQSLPTRIVREYAKRFPGRDVNTIKKLIDDINSFERVEVKHFFEKYMYQKQTAEDLIATRRIPARTFRRRMPEEVRRLSPKVPQYQRVQFGCNSMCVALASVLRVKGIPAWYVRTTGLYYVGEPVGVSHSVIRFRLGGNDYLADPHAENPAERLLDLSDPEMGENIARLKKAGAWVEGKDSWAIGIRNWKNFDDLNPSVKRRGGGPAIGYGAFEAPAE